MNSLSLLEAFSATVHCYTSANAWVRIAFSASRTSTIAELSEEGAIMPAPDANSRTSAPNRFFYNGKAKLA